MKRIVKVVGIGLASLLGLILLVAAVLHFVGLGRLNRAPDVVGRPVPVPAESAAIARGEYLVGTVSSCRSCHGDQLEGSVFIDGEIGMYVTAPNLSGGLGGIGGDYSDADWERAIRHGIGADGRVLVIMPVNFYQHYSDDDLGAVIAYLKSVPPVDNELGPRRIGFPASLLGGVFGFDEFTNINAVDHAAVGGEQPIEAATEAYGEYLVNIAICGECHGPNLTGVVLAEGEDGPPEGPNLTPGGELRGWNEADFRNALRTGRTPSGRELDPEQMPWPALGQMSDTELLAIWAYLQSLPPLATNGAGEWEQ